MPVEFRCPSCSKLLRTPDESAGKKAKCPQCGTIVDVPTGSTGPDSGTPPLGAGPFPPEKFEPSPFAGGGGFNPPKPGAEFGEGSVNPYAAPSTSVPPFAPRSTVEEGGRPGLPWEQLPKSLRVFWDTSKLILSAPTTAFSIMQREGGLGGPIGYLMIGGLIGGFFSGLYNTLMQIGMLTLMDGVGGQNPDMPFGNVQWFQVAIAMPQSIMAGTIGALISSFIGAALNHVILMMVGGANHSFETTYRVVAYVNGAVALLQVIPMCGQLVMFVMALSHTIIGLSNAHRTSGGKAAAAVLLPIGICICGLGLLLFGIFAAVGVAAQ